MVVEFQKEEPQESVFKEEESRNRDPLKAWAHVSLTSSSFLCILLVKAKGASLVSMEEDKEAHLSVGE